jgi:WD40 repeat protein
VVFTIKNLPIQWRLAFNPDGQTVACGYDAGIEIRSATSGEAMSHLNGGTVHALAYSADGHTLVSGSWDNTVTVWDVSAAKKVRTLSGHTGWVNAVALSPDGKTIFSAGMDKSVMAWDLSSGKLLHTSAAANSVYALICTPDGKSLAVGQSDGAIKVFNVADGKDLGTLRGHTGAVTSLGCTRDGGTIFSGSEDGTIKLWKLDHANAIGTIVPLKMSDWIVFTPDGRFDCSPGGEKFIHWVADNEIIDFDQLKDKLAEPGLLVRLLTGRTATHQ